MATTYKYLDVTLLETGVVVHRLDVTGVGERLVDRAEMGLLRHLDLDKYTVVERAYSTPQEIDPKGA